MKLSDDFDARRLRPRNPRRWPLCLAAGLALLCLLAGLGSLFSAAVSLWYNPFALDEPRGAAAVLAPLGLVLLGLGILGWRLCRRRLRRSSELSMAPHLLKKRH